jgi:hypothetical protein
VILFPVACGAGCVLNKSKEKKSQSRTAGGKKRSGQSETDITRIT